MEPDDLFEPLIQALAGQGFGYMDHFLTEDHIRELLEVLLTYRGQDEFRKAGIGTAHLHQIDRSVRGDHIRWIEPEQALEPTRRYLERMQAFIAYLNRTLYVGIRDFEAHFAYYPPGTFYKRHLDQLKINDHRRISFILYLNSNWQPEHGGALRLYVPAEPKEMAVDIAPLGGRLLVFRSDLLEHEVLPTVRDRFSVTGWMLDRPRDISFLG